MDNSPKQYQAYMLRLWREDPLSPLRIIIENVQSQEKQGFGSLPELVDFLQQDFESLPDRAARETQQDLETRDR
jgi:hypothetical protein